MCYQIIKIYNNIISTLLAVVHNVFCIILTFINIFTYLFFIFITRYEVFNIYNNTYFIHVVFDTGFTFNLTIDLLNVTFDIIYDY